MPDQKKILEPLRALLFVPADSERKMKRAQSSGADVVIFDLEDSVALDAKAAARSILAEHLAKTINYRFAVRVNGNESDTYIKDLAAVVPFSPEFIMLPKCQNKDDVKKLCDALSGLENDFKIATGSVGILPLVTETAYAALSLDYRDAGERLVGLAFAGEDLSADLGVNPRDQNEVLNPLLADIQRRVAIAAAAAGVRAIDTPFPNHRNSDGLLTETRLAALLGFAGKLCIHPNQIESVREIFMPDPDRLAWAHAVKEVLQENANGVGVVDGKMVDMAHLKLANRILANGFKDG